MSAVVPPLADDANVHRLIRWRVKCSKAPCNADWQSKENIGYAWNEPVRDPK